MDKTSVHFMHFCLFLCDIFINFRHGYGFVIQKDFIRIRQVNSSHPDDLYPKRMCVALHKQSDGSTNPFLELKLDKYLQNNEVEDSEEESETYVRPEKKSLPRYRVNGGRRLVKLHRTKENKNDLTLNGRFCVDGSLVIIKPIEEESGTGYKDARHYMIFHDHSESESECLEESQEESEEHPSDESNESDLDTSLSEGSINDIVESDEIEDARASNFALSNAFGKYVTTGDERVRRTQHLTIELLMVVDYAAYSWWQSVVENDPTDNNTDAMSLIRQFYAFIFQGIDGRFRSIETQPYMIDLAFAGLFVAKTEQESFWTTESVIGENVDNARVMVNSSEALDKFQKWLDGADFLPSYDHAILFTGTNLSYAGSPGNTGLAFESSMCRNISNSSIVEDIFDFRTVTYSTQQIARSLGSRDDMDNNNCLEFFNHIMAPKFKLPIRSFVTNRWKFSSCSEQYFLEYTSELTDLGLTCLNDQFGVERYPPEMAKLVENLPGTVYTGRKQCENRFGLGSDICRENIGESYDEICAGLMCTIPGENHCDYILPADGTPCGNKKYCWHGKCLEFEDAVESSDTCVFGNDPETNCDTITPNTRAHCYNESIRYKCCSTCEFLHTGLSTCEYGDRSEDCSMNGCVNGDDTYKTITCCLTCSDGPTPYSPVAVTDMFPLQQSPTPLTSETSGISTVPLSSSITPSAILHAISSLAALVEASVSDSLYSTASVSADISTTPSTDNIASQTTTSDVFATTDGPPFENNNDGSNDYRNGVYSDTDPQANLEPSTHSKSPEGQDGSSYNTGESFNGVPSYTSDRFRTKAEHNEGEDRNGNIQQLEEGGKDSGAHMSTNDRCKCPNSLTEGVSVSPKIKTSDRSSPCEQTKQIDENGSLYDRIFFKDLARSMQNNQRHIRQSLRIDVQSLYRSVSLKLRVGNHEFETENESGREGGEDEDLNRKLLPIWRQHYNEMMRGVERNVRELRYRVLALLNRHFKYRNYRRW